MRPARRKPSRRRGVAAKPPVPSRPRRPGQRHGNGTLDELRRGREAVSDIVGQLDHLLEQLRAPATIDTAAPDRLAGAARQANNAFAALAQLRRLLP
jgi:hypothetical protein